MRVQDFVKKNVSTVKGDASIQEVARKMADEDIGFLPVVDQSGKPVGTVTDRDIVVRLIAKGSDVRNARVEQVMTKNVVSVRPDENIDRVADLMKERKVSRVLICDQGGKPVGVISLGDLAERTDEQDVGRTVKEVKEGTTLTH
ncbi:MAG TPA: CBS domain-containing protein [Myxococcales bacterium]|nr:CBS domain-containing protein [Myxococcales bacterium]